MSTTATPLPLQNKVVIITGVGCGIGKELARALASNGAKIVAVDPDATQAKNAVDGLPGCRYAACDPDDEYSRRLLVEDVVAKWGRIDATIDSAALIYAGPLANANEAA